jgi:hypothetical protein
LVERKRFAIAVHSRLVANKDVGRIEAAKVLGLIAIRHMRDIAEEQRQTTAVEDGMQPLSDHTVIAPEAPLTEALSA